MLTVELQDHKEKVYHNILVSPKSRFQCLWFGVLTLLILRGLSQPPSGFSLVTFVRQNL